MVKFKHIILMVLIFTLLATLVSANGISITLKRTNPGIVGIEPAELIFDIVNTNMDYNVQGFILCQPPDDVTISSSLGFSAGSGAQYVSPYFEMSKAPSQKAVYLTLNSDFAGDYNSNCVFRYIFFREENGVIKYQKMNLAEVDQIRDSDYREIRLDKSIPFVQANGDYVQAYCPSGLSSCKSNEVILQAMKDSNLLLYISIFLIMVSMTLIAIIIGRSKK